MSLHTHKVNCDRQARFLQNLLDSQRAADKVTRNQQKCNKSMERRFAEIQSQNSKPYQVPLSRGSVAPMNYSCGATGVHLPYDGFIDRCLSYLESPKDVYDVFAGVFGFFGMLQTFAAISMPTMFCVASGTTFRKMDKAPVWLLLRLTALFWGMFGVTLGTKKIVQLFKKHRRQHTKEMSV